MKKIGLPEYLMVPKIVLEDKDLTIVDGLICGLIYWFTKLKMEKCILSNASIAELLRMKQGSVANSISRLAKRGCIKVVLDKNNHRKEIVSLIAFTRSSEGGSSYNEGGVHPTMNIIRRGKNKKTLYINKKADGETKYLAGVLAQILNDEKSISYYKILCSNYDPHKLIEKAKTIIADGGAKNPAAVFVAWVKELE